MRYLFTLILLTTIFSTAPLQAALINAGYVKAQLGLDMKTDGSIEGTEVITDVDEPPYFMTLGGGINLGPMFSLALEINYETAEMTEIPSSVTKDDVKRFGSLLNAYFHFPKLVGLQPFIGGGAGYALVTMEDNDYKGDGFIWQLSAGTDLELNDIIALTAEARFLEPFDIDLENDSGDRVGDFDFSQSKLMLGVKIKI